MKEFAAVGLEIRYHTNPRKGSRHGGWLYANVSVDGARICLLGMIHQDHGGIGRIMPMLCSRTPGYAGHRTDEFCLRHHGAYLFKGNGAGPENCRNVRCHIDDG